MPRYIVLMHDPVTLQTKMRSSKPEDVKAIVGRYMAWAGKMSAAGRMRGGEKLTLDSGRVLHGLSGCTTGPYRKEDALGGFFIIDADGYDHAAELCRDNPQLEEGGVIELRELAEMAR